MPALTLVASPKFQAMPVHCVQHGVGVLLSSNGLVSPRSLTSLRTREWSATRRRGQPKSNNILTTRAHHVHSLPADRAEQKSLLADRNTSTSSKASSLRQAGEQSSSSQSCQMATTLLCIVPLKSPPLRYPSGQVPRHLPPEKMAFQLARRTGSLG